MAISKWGWIAIILVRMKAAAAFQRRHRELPTATSDPKLNPAEPRVSTGCVSS
jgi:hypothetical protein